MIYKLLLPIILLVASSRANAQNDISDFNNMYMFSEVGKTKAYQLFIQGGIAFQVDHHYFKIKSEMGIDHIKKEQRELFKSYHKDCECTQDQRMFQSIALVYGRSYRLFKHHQIQFGTGFSVFIKTDPDEVFNKMKQPYEPEQFTESYTVGLPGEARYSFQFKRYLALSVTASGNTNFIRSYSALSAGVAIGLF